MELLQTLFFLLLGFICSTFSELSEDDFGDCRPIYTHNYGYKIYFHLPKISVLSDTKIDLSFALQTSSDGHILLSQTPNPKDTDPVYEIVVGAGWNTFSDIRRLHQGSFRATNITRNIVNKNALKLFWIKINDGHISVGEANVSVPFLQIKDENPLSVKFMSFSSWRGTHATWFFDCWGATAVPKNGTVSEKLRSDLFTLYDPYVVPVSEDFYIIVNTKLNISYVNLDPSQSSMDIRGTLRVNWIDYKLQWSPAGYGSIEIIRLTDRKIWTPAFFLLNGATLHQKWFDDGILTVNYEGVVSWTTSVHFVTRCNFNMDGWPDDEHSCLIQIGVASSHQNVHIAESSEINMEDMNAGIWEILSVNRNRIYMSTPWDEVLPDTNSSEDDLSSVLSIEISMKRYSSSYYFFLNIPLKVNMMISLISFWLSYTCPQRVILQVIVLVVYVVNLLSIGAALPSFMSETPSIVSLSCGSFLTATVCTVLTVWLKLFSQSRKDLSIPLILDKLVNFFTLQLKYFTSYEIKGEQKLMNLEDEDEESGSTKNLDHNCKVMKNERFQAFLILLDHLLLITVIIIYSTLLIIF